MFSNQSITSMDLKEAQNYCHLKSISAVGTLLHTTENFPQAKISIWYVLAKSQIVFFLPSTE